MASYALTFHFVVTPRMHPLVKLQNKCDVVACSILNSRVGYLTLRLGHVGKWEAKMSNTSKAIGNVHKRLSLMNLSGTKTLECSKP
jgi:hypothetical protein